MKSTIGFFILLIALAASAQPAPRHGFEASKLPARWDEALPLGNGWLGCLVWQNDGRIRLSLDRADLWDLRPMKGLVRPEFRYRWVAEQVAKGDYGIVQDYFDAPYEREPGPTKLPGAALEFGLDCGDVHVGTVRKAVLDIRNGLATLWFDGGMRLRIFVHATRPEGWYRLDFPDTPPPGDTPRFLPGVQLVPPAYGGNSQAPAGGSVQGDDLARLGYTPGSLRRPAAMAFLNEAQQWVYDQPGWGGFRYQVAVFYRYQNGGLEGVWSISSHFPGKKSADAEKIAQRALKRGFEKSLAASSAWWAEYWSKSALQVPDSLLERQYYRDMYKFGCIARADAPMISLQAVWTADNGRLPPWKGDLHHDLNTQMSYWPAWAANHPELALGYLNHLERNAQAHRRYTRQYFGTGGLNVPGVETLDGEPMGGWIQYSCSPTVSAWLAQHFYGQWRYTRDRRFLKKHAWPWLRDVAIHLEQITCRNDQGQRVLPLSSSPEINDNSINAWFPNTWTNYDLALTAFVFEKTAELARVLGDSAAARHWEGRRAELPPFATDADGAFRFAPTLPYRESHRHFSHLMAIHPLGLTHWDQGPEAQKQIQTSLKQLDAGSGDWWTGYSYAWLANLRARAHDGAGAREALRIFAEAFVSANSFHLNGDQSGRGYSKMTYRPFTLEGNFAYAAGLQEMLLQSHGPWVDVFPATPPDWKDVSFRQLRAEGAFLVDAQKQNGRLVAVQVRAEQGGRLHLRLPETGLKPVQLTGGRLVDSPLTDGRHWVVEMEKRGVLRLERNDVGR